MRKVILGCVVAFLWSYSVSAQRTFKGTLEFSYGVTGEGAEMMAAFMPEKLSLKVGDNVMVMQMHGGMMAAMMGRIVTTGYEAYTIIDDKKIVYEMSKDDLGGEAESTPDYQLISGEQKQIMGYSCKLYRYTIVDEEGNESTTDTWVTDKLKMPKMKGPLTSEGGMMGNLPTNIDGVPLEVRSTVSGANYTIVMTAITVKEETISSSDYERPKGYEVKPFSEFSPGF
jgi:hypothetical protein